ELGVPATIFVATAFLDGDRPFPFDDWQAAGSRWVPPDSWRPLSTAQCSEMQAGGLIDLGSHTHTHAIFRARPEAFVNDLRASLNKMSARFGLEQVPFSFPFGIADPDLIAAARRSGVLCGLTTQCELVRPWSDPFTWGRFNVTDSDTS